MQRSNTKKQKKGKTQKRAKGAEIVVQPKPQRHPLVARAEAERRTATIKERARGLVRDWWTLGLEVRAAIDDRIPEALGESAHGWLVDCFGESWQKIYRSLRILRALEGVPTKQLAELTEGNAFELTQLPEKARISSEWLKRAQEMKNEDFRLAVGEELRTRYKVKKESMLLIARVLGFTTIPESLKITIDEAMARAAIVHELDLATKGGRIAAVEAVFAEFLTTVQVESISDSASETEERSASEPRRVTDNKRASETPSEADK